MGKMKFVLQYTHILYHPGIERIEEDGGYEERDIGKAWETEREYKRKRHLKEVWYQIDLIEGFKRYPGGDA